MAFKEAHVSTYMAAIGRRGGLIGGKRRLTTMSADERRISARNAAIARSRKMSADERRELARKAAAARWRKKDQRADL